MNNAIGTTPNNIEVYAKDAFSDDETLKMAEIMQCADQKTFDRVERVAWHKEERTSKSTSLKTVYSPRATELKSANDEI